MQKRRGERAELSGNGLPVAWHRSMGSAALIASLGAMAVITPALADQSVLLVNKGADGNNGDAGFIGSDATAGQNAAASVWVQTAPITGVTGSALQIGSVGGAGGSLFSPGVFRNRSGKPGGAAGFVSLDILGSADISGTLGSSAQPLINIYSIGGTGGLGYNSVIASGSGIARGGDGGQVDLNIGSRINAISIDGARTSTLPAIKALSQGGAAGVSKDGRQSQDGTTSDRVDTDRGGSGGQVTVGLNQDASVNVTGALAPAIYAGSLGGNGGSAANSGGYPSNGGAGGSVNFINLGTVTTNGNNSTAVILQSAGGVGGTGAAGAFSSGTPGGTGGAGGVVTANNQGAIATQGDYSFGIMAQSVGGVGGNGGGAAFTSGGNGGGAGLGGVVSVTNDGTITTTGKGATAIMAQSIGGGSALDAFYATTPVINRSGGGTGGNSGILPFFSGGTGGLGGVGGSVAIDHLGNISTVGDLAYGVLAQSVGGGGGTGGAASSSMAFLAVALGGAGGGGGNGGQVTFESAQGSSIQTAGKGATAVLAQSIGGGGGAGGYATSKSVSPGLSASSATGGSGGKGGSGGIVNISNNSAIQTSGEAALGLQASSIGGGGGTGGIADAFAAALPAVTPSGQPLPSITLTNAVGGSGGDGGAGKLALVDNHAAIETFGVGATGILAQSIGGGGGNAGNAYAYGLAIAVPGATAFNVTNTIGGSGGGGGSSEGARVVNDGNVRTNGDGAVGIEVQSIGGGGGNAGSASTSADALSLYRTIVFGQTIGGTNSNVGGGAGGFATIENSGVVETRGTGSMGILLQSIGGGGGNGGAVNASAASGLSFDKTLDSLVKKLPLADSLTIVDAIGGSGGNGGNGGIVNATLTSASVVRTRGAQSDGVFAQSIGGGGGTGGGGSATASGKLTVKLSFGGTGGAGGSGGTVTVNNAGAIETYGDASHGIFAQSIGGGGGNGGNLAAADDTAPDTVGELFAALKKAVGVDAYQAWAKDKGNAETKEQLDALIKDIQDSDTYKQLSDAFKQSDLYKQMQKAGASVTTYLKAQADGSVKRPDLSLTLSMSGAGGSGNVGGVVDLTNSGSILTTGDVSYGMLGQSVGGGGGQGGVAYASGTNKTNLSGTAGGKGGSGNLGGEVKLTNRGAIQTWGEASYGLYAQSVGGGGGIGVGALSSGNKNLVVNFTMGGDGGLGANGGNVTVANTGTINTRGDEAHGIVAQSVGGGGGAFMMSTVGKESAAPVVADDAAVSADSVTALLKALGIDKVAAVSTDADGEKPSSKSGSVTLGGTGGGSGNGGTVDIAHSGSVATSGTAAFGVFAQSIGGGGGISNAAGSPGGVKYAASYGGNGGSSGNGGAINVNFTDNAAIRTSGDYSTAVYAQSVGGGGGYGGASVLQGYTLPVLSGKGGTSGDGGAIDVRTISGSTTIQTTGAKAHGVFAQSLGGGGGSVSATLKTDETARAALQQSATVLTGIISQVGGSGTVLDNIDKVPESLQGIVRLFGNDSDTVNSVLTAIQTSLNQRSASLGTGGNISINLNGNISASGADSYGLFAQSGFQQSNGSLDPDRAGGKITIAYSGMLLGGSGNGAAIVVDGGNSENTITINKDANVSAQSGHAVISTFGQELLRNYGTLAGDIDLASGGSTERNEFRNESGGTYISGGNGIVNVGSGPGRVYNAGTFDVGGVGKIATATVKGGEYMYLGGILRVDVNSMAAAGKQNADLLKSSNIRVDGVAIKPYAIQGLLPGTSFTVVSADKLDVQRQTVSGASVASPISWSVTQNGNNLAIAPSSADFIGRAQGNITDTERSLLNSLQNAWDTGRPGVANIFAGMANIDTADQYESAINSLAVTEDLGQLSSRQTLAGRKSLNAALSCPVFDGDTINLRETQCTWARVTGSRFTQSDSAVADGSKQEGLSYRVGGQWEIRPDWFFGATAAYNTTTMHTNDGLTAVRGQGGDVSFSLKHQAGPWLLAGAVHAGYGSYDSDTRFMVGDDEWRAENRNGVWTGGLRMRAAYEVAGNEWYVRPYVDLDVLRSYMPGYTLSGDGATLKSGAMKQWAVAVTPTIEAGTRINAGRFGWLRPYASVGASFLKSGGSSSTVSFSDGSGDAIAFTSSSPLPDRLVNVGAGLQLYAKDRYEVRAEYLAQMGQSSTNQELSLRVAISF